jgi:hypothetical protein
VQAETVSGQDWRDAAAYAPLLGADRTLFAWEWLRRDPGYRAAARLALDSQSSLAAESPGPDTFGLVVFERPELQVPLARPLWRSDADPCVLRATSEAAASNEDCFDLKRVEAIARLVAENGAEHLLLSDGLQVIRLDGPPGTFTSGPVCLRYSLRGLASAEGPLLSLRRLLGLARTGSFAHSLHRREPRARRWVLMLRAWDALAAGASQRDIAEQLLGRSVAEPGWRARDPSIRSQAQRLVRSARLMADGRHCELLSSRKVVRAAHNGQS